MEEGVAGLASFMSSWLTYFVIGLVWLKAVLVAVVVGVDVMTGGCGAGPMSLKSRSEIPFAAAERDICLGVLCKANNPWPVIGKNNKKKSKVLEYQNEHDDSADKT